MVNILWVEGGVDNLVASGKVIDDLTRSGYNIYVAGCLDDLLEAIEKPKETYGCDVTYDIIFLNLRLYITRAIKFAVEEEPENRYSAGLTTYSILIGNKYTKTLPVVVFR